MTASEREPRRPASREQASGERASQDGVARRSAHVHPPTSNTSREGATAVSASCEPELFAYRNVIRSSQLRQIIAPGQRLGYRLIQGMAIDDSRPLANGHNLLSRNGFQGLNPSARPAHIEAVHGRRAAKAEVHAHVVLPEVARPGAHLADKPPRSRPSPSPSPRCRPGCSGALAAVTSSALPERASPSLREQVGRLSVVADQQIQIAVVVDVAGSRALCSPSPAPNPGPDCRPTSVKRPFPSFRSRRLRCAYRDVDLKRPALSRTCPLAIARSRSASLS